MGPTPSGHLLGGADRPELVLTRTFHAPVKDVWASLTEPGWTARWFARWTGEAGTGATVRLQFTHEEGAPEGELKILACEPPRRLELLAVDPSGSWHVELRLAEQHGATELSFVHHLAPGDDLASTGAGWEYYLDLLVATRAGRPLPEFADYYPAMREYYASLSR